MSLKILIVDDTQEIIDLTRHVLEKRGFSVLVETDGHSVIKTITRESPNLVILDNLLPGKNGIEICREIKLNDAIKHIPVILATGQRLENDALQTDCPPDSYLFKPFDIDELLKQVRTFLN